MEKLIGLNQLEATVGFKKSKLYELIHEGTFPKPLKIGRSSRWRSTEIEAWIEKIAEESPR